MTERQTVSSTRLIDLAFETGAVIERDPETERLRLRHEGIEYVAALDGAA